MSDDSHHRQPHERSGDDPLDRLLAQARWPDPSESSVRRLELAWDTLTDRPRPRLSIGWSAAAAVLIVSIVIVGALVRRPTRSAVHAPANPDASRQAPDQPPVVIASRAPSLWEQAVMLNAHSPTASVDRIQPAIDQAIASLATASGADARTLAAPLLGSGSRTAIEQHLLDDIKRRSGPEQLAAIRLLGIVGTDSSLPTLLYLYAVEHTRAAAAASVAELLAPNQLAARIVGEPDPERQRHLLGVLVSHPAPRGLSTYLSFVANPVTSDAALAALDDVADAPVDALFTHLDAPRTDYRLAAARALGRINGPIVSERLASMVARNVHRREALAALMSSGGSDASRFLSGFRQIPSLLSVIRSIEPQLRNPF